MRKLLRGLLLAATSLALIAASGGIWLHGKLNNSLPLLDGRIVLNGLTATVTVERDALGVPTVRGANRSDIARATGFLHAQDRYFQMDLLRRSAAGELAELFGETALEVDLAVRRHRFRSRAQELLHSLPPADRELVGAYTAGVNAGLSALAAPPFEYLLLRQPPTPWRPEDMALVIYAMYLDLQNGNHRLESAYGLMHELLPRPLYEFLAPWGSEWDAPLVGKPFTTPPVPGPEVFDLRDRPIIAQAPIDSETAAVLDGSNNWAVTGSHTAHGGALLANDMHLGLAVPNTWYRASFV